VENIELHLREIGWRGIGWIDLVQDMDKWNEYTASIKY
jgi:hypothetical protein